MALSSSFHTDSFVVLAAILIHIYKSKRIVRSLVSAARQRVVLKGYHPIRRMLKYFYLVLELFFIDRFASSSMGHERSSC